MASTINSSTSNGIVITPDTSGEIELQANGVTKAKITANGLQDANGASLRGGMYRNLIINGDMQIAQRATSATLASGYNTVDRLYCAVAGGAYTQTQDTDVPSGQGFAYSVKTSCTSALGSPASGDVILLSQKIEGQNLQHLKKGTSDAESLTISFWVKSNQTGTFVFSFRDQLNSRRNNNLVTISSADTWEKKIITIVGDTSGTINNNNTVGLELQFWLGQGSDYDGGTHVDGWHTEVVNGIAAGTTYELFSSTSNYINITGLQLEVGSGSSDFEFLPYDVQLARCQRYAYKLGGEISNYYADSAGGYWDANYIGFGKIRFPVPMRTAPSATFTAGGGINVWRGNTTYTGFSWNITISGNPTTRDCFIVGNKTSHGVTVDAGAMIKFEDTAANCLFSAEL